MAPAFAIPRLLARNGLTYADIDLWEIHEAFAAQVLFHIKALERPGFPARTRPASTETFGAFPRERVNPNGGSVALGHPFGATGARILSQTVKELAASARRDARASSASAPTAARAASSCWNRRRSPTRGRDAGGGGMGPADERDAAPASEPRARREIGGSATSARNAPRRPRSI